MMKQTRKPVFFALMLAAIFIVSPNPAKAGVNITFNNGPSCQGYTRNFIDAYGYQRVATGTSCLQHDGVWRVVSEGPSRVISMPYYAYPQPVAYSKGWHKKHHDNRRNWNRYDHHDHNHDRHR